MLAQRGLRLILISSLACAPAAQAPKQDKLEAKLRTEATKILLGFARAATNNGMHADAARAYRLVIERYNSGHGGARRGLGHEKVGGQWRPPEPATEAKNAGDASKSKRTAASWKRAAQKLAKRHFEVAGTAREAGAEALAERHFKLALDYDENHRAAHLALGHTERDGFFGSKQQIDFLDRLASIEEKARELGRTAIPMRTLEHRDLPKPLRATGLEFSGARSKHYEVWVRDDQDAADEVTRWAERAHLLLEHLLHGQEEHLANLERGSRSVAWFCLLNDHAERDQFLAANPDKLGDRHIDDVKRFGGIGIRAPGGKAYVNWHHEGSRNDSIVSSVAYRSWTSYGNSGLGQGLMHTVCRLLVGTTRTYFGQLPTTETSAKAGQRPDPLRRLKLLREQIRAGEDWPLVQVPRERSQHFRRDVRVKSFSFMHWLIARHPDEWADLMFAIPWNDIPMPEEVDAVIQRVLGRSVESVEAEWREWARGDSAIARASGHGER